MPSTPCAVSTVGGRTRVMSPVCVAQQSPQGPKTLANTRCCRAPQMAKRLIELASGHTEFANMYNIRVQGKSKAAMENRNMWGESAVSAPTGTCGVSQQRQHPVCTPVKPPHNMVQGLGCGALFGHGHTKAGASTAAGPSPSSRALPCPECGVLTGRCLRHLHTELDLLMVIWSTYAPPPLRARRPKPSVHSVCETPPQGPLA